MITEAAITDYICKVMTEKQYTSVSSADEADGAFAIMTNDSSQWYSIYSDLFSFEDPKLFKDYALTMSFELKTDILGISCFDSDFLYLNLIDAARKIDAWVGVGSTSGLGIRKRTNLSAWKNKVSDINQFKDSISKEFVFADDILAEVEPCIHLPAEFSGASYEYLSDFNLSEKAVFLYFKLPEATKTQDVPKLEQWMPSLMPCFLEKPSIVSAINVGGASKGLSVYFIGPYVEHEEITFSDVCFVKHKHNQTESIPFKLEKVQLSDGQWAYYYHDPGYKIMPKVDERLSMMKQLNAEAERSITIRFVPHGNSRKILDITVILVPDKNTQGKTEWNVWRQFGSKKEYIQFHNQGWSQHPYSQHLLLNEEDYD